MRGHIILCHGSDSGPDATKVSVLAQAAQRLGWTAERPDFRQDDALGYAGCIEPRLARLRAAIDAAPQPPVLVGSSMGAFVAGLVSLHSPVRALFLLALPISIPGCPPFDMRRGIPSMLVHGYDDELCPVDAALAFARSVAMPALMLADDHRLGASVEVITGQFGLFLETLTTGTTSS